jgi:hypothetical protein
MDFLTGTQPGQQPYGQQQQMPQQQQQMPQQQSSGFLSGVFGSSTPQSAASAQVTSTAQRLVTAQNPQEKYLAASELEAVAKTQVKLAEHQLGLTQGNVRGTSMRSGLNASEMMSVHGMGANGMGANRMGASVMGYGGKRHRTHHRRKQRGGSCGHGVASHAATFKGGRRRKRNGKKRTHRRR